MTTLQVALERYLSVRRALGYKLRPAEGLLRGFVEFAKLERAAYITTDLALRWATESTHATQKTWANRLGVVRRFARYCHANNSRHVVPPRDLLPHQSRRRSPYLYSDKEIYQLMSAARNLPTTIGLKPHTYATLIGLYVSTGLRANEALCLNRNDVDLGNGVLSIRKTKFGKDRYVPVHASTQSALRHYDALRDRLRPNPTCDNFFLSDRGAQISYPALRATFVKLSVDVGIRAPGDSHGPGLHGFRHRLAIQTLLRWYRRGVDVECRMPQLSTYLGHSNIAHTQWYLTATPQLLRYALNRVEKSEKRRRH